MKKLLLFGVLCLSASAMHAQTISIVNGGSRTGLRTDSIAKKVLGTAQYKVGYVYHFSPDSLAPSIKNTARTLLKIGDHYCSFSDQYRLAFDSITDAMARKSDASTMALGAMMGALRKAKFDENIVFDLQSKKETVQKIIGVLHTYQYDEPLTTPNWKLEEGDTTILGYPCSKATTTLFGRDYVAWYAPDLAMPYGPYKFNGLPGLVLRVTDTRGLFDFSAESIEKAAGYDPIYLLTKKEIIKTSRKNVRKAYANYCADPLSSLAGQGITVPEESRSKVQSKPYNPIERE
jgi:GLPGLI family protein